MQTYPKVEDLAAASEDDVLKLWQGLGHKGSCVNFLGEERKTNPQLVKGHPTAEEIKGAVDFFDKIEDEYGDIIVEEYAKREKRLAYEKEHPAGGLVAGVKRTAKKIANKL